MPFLAAGKRKPLKSFKLDFYFFLFFKPANTSYNSNNSSYLNEPNVSSSPSTVRAKTPKQPKSNSLTSLKLPATSDAENKVIVYNNQMFTNGSAMEEDVVASIMLDDPGAFDRCCFDQNLFENLIQTPVKQQPQSNSSTPLKTNGLMLNLNGNSNNNDNVAGMGTKQY